MKKYYSVICKCGHADSTTKCIFITFPIIAESKKEAAYLGRKMPRVKHHHKDAVKDVKEISKEEYLKLKELNDKDSYLHCSNIQEQRQLNIDYRFVDDLYMLSKKILKNRKTSNKRVYDSKIKIKYPKAYIRNNVVINKEDLLMEVEAW